MTQPNAVTCLENACIRLDWRDDTLQVLNRLSGRTRALDFPAFGICLADRMFDARDFTAAGVEQAEQRVTFSFRCDETALDAKVSYWLEDDKPWFRKQVVLRSPQPLPTPGRLWVDVQQSPPEPVRRVGYGLRGGCDAAQQDGLDTYAGKPACGYPVYAGDWFFGLEHATGFAVPGETLELYHHPVWDGDGQIRGIPAVFGAAASHERVADAFMDYVWHIRLPRLSSPFVTVTIGWSTPILGGGEYVDSFEANEAFLDAMLEIGLRPDALAIDAGYFDRRSIFHHKDDDAEDSRFAAFSRLCRTRGLELSLWVSHNGRTGFDMDWIRSQGWLTGEGEASTYKHGEFVVMMQPDFEEALAQRFERLVGEIGARHLKIDWDNECATCAEFEQRYPTLDHVREASINAFNRIERRARAANPKLITRNGWWPSPWWLCSANHVWLVDSGDCEYAAWPSRTQRDREITHRDAMYYHITRRAETPCPLDAFDNHGFADALQNCFSDEPHTWQDNAVLAVTRGTTYMHMPLCPEGLRQWQVDALQHVLDWMHEHAAELGTRGAEMVGGDPAAGEVYGFLHPAGNSAWLVLRNPSPQPQPVLLCLEDWLGFTPQTVRQVYPFWHDVEPLRELPLLGHEVRLLLLSREQSPDPSPVAGVPFMVRAHGDGYEYSFPGNRPVSERIGPSVHPDMQIPELTAELTADEAVDGGWRLQWYACVPYRFERAELILTLRGAAECLDAVTVRAGCCRYRGAGGRHIIAAERIFRREERGHGTTRVLPPLGPRERDDYGFRVPDGGWVSLTVDIAGTEAGRLGREAWLTGYQGAARQTLCAQRPPMPGALLPLHPYGFSTCLRLC